MIEQGQACIRLMTDEDIDQIVRVEMDSFTMPWTASVFENELINNKYAHYLVYDYNGEIIGYCGLWVVMDEAQVTNIAIHSDYRGHKRGERLLSYAKSFVALMGVKRLSLEVRVSNVVAQGLYRKLGFQEGGIRKNYYADNSEDAIVMWVKIDENK
ncbi:ribosomal protein S18-alanine N-acetyltransferase [Bacillus solitudinis]|uniref:ribosomal protein S18-alanine N-acetyltransferase n=1 Tax=Bacillus solitudinis TaxID=2014074 RepID=UPI000C238832|nr:ribosomal protein S18-alanine N-acetyltransferase [Bacillus solitudinis]